jgi:acyl carrier protein
VKKYAEIRKDELKNAEEDTTGNREKCLAALEQDITGATKWDELSFDDLDRVEVLLEVEDAFNHIIPDDESDAIQSVSETVAYLGK